MIFCLKQRESQMKTTKLHEQFKANDVESVNFDFWHFDRQTNRKDAHTAHIVREFIRACLYMLCVPSDTKTIENEMRKINS